MSHIEIWITYIYEIDNFTETWMSSNTYKLPKHVFSNFLVNIYIMLNDIVWD